MKRLLSVLLAVLLLASLASVPVLAAGGDGSGGGNGKSPLNVSSVKINGTALDSVSSVPASGTIVIGFTRGMGDHSEATMAAIKIADADCKVTFDGDRTFTVTFAVTVRP